MQLVAKYRQLVVQCPQSVSYTHLYAFHRYFFLATRHREDGTAYTNLSFPLIVPKEPDKTVGFEERGRPRMDGSGSYKGKAEGSNSNEGLWAASPAHTLSLIHIYRRDYFSAPEGGKEQPDKAERKNTLAAVSGEEDFPSHPRRAAGIEMCIRDRLWRVWNMRFLNMWLSSTKM